MFYSHEILSNSKYGVATIWLVATVGRNVNKRVTRKAIQQVNVSKACQTIIDPEAPLALRLQGNLLYGISRVFASQCTYVLNDAEKTQSDMMTFFRTIQTSEIDPQAGKTKPHQITLQDDPNFDPMNTLPRLDLLNIDKDFVPGGSQGSSQKASQSQFTPLTFGSQGNSSNGRGAPFFQLDLPHSSPSAMNYALPLNIDRHSSSVMKQTPEKLMGEFVPFGQQGDDLFTGVNLDFGDDGNLLEVRDYGEQELPILPRLQEDNLHHGPEQIDMQAGREQAVYHTGDDGVFIMEEDRQPESNVIYRNGAGQPREGGAAADKKTHKNKKITPDDKIILERSVVMAWQRDYAENMEQARNGPKRGKGSAAFQSKRMAEDLLFNNGLAGVGLALPIPHSVHPLAEEFSGVMFKAQILGLSPADIQNKSKSNTGRRRKPQEAFGDEPEDRRTRSRFDGEDPEHGRGPGDLGDQGIFGDDYLPEMGMDAAPGMNDHHSSTMPWTRPGSAIPSSVRDPGSNQKSRAAPSPLLGRGSVINPIERHSDAHHGSEDFRQLRSQASSYDVGGEKNDGEGLDVASREFLGYATHNAEQFGVERQNRHWIDFENLADPTQHGKTVAAEAFLHVLSLATKNIIKVRQNGADTSIPYGRIEVGINTGKEQGPDMDLDELA